MKQLFNLCLIMVSLTSGAQNTIQYYLANENSPDSTELRAVVNGNEFTLIGLEEFICFDIEKTHDFNHNGFEDVLVEINIGCGGTCCAFSYTIFSYDGQYFRQTETVGYDWDGIEISESASEFIFTVQTVLEGFGSTEMCKDKIETYRLAGYKLDLIQTIKHQKLDAIAEIKSADFTDREDETLSFDYDFDNDGIVDQLCYTYWSRWGRISRWEINFASGMKYTGDSTPKRIGILDTKTNGFCDLVLECDEILKWNGLTYESYIK